MTSDLHIDKQNNYFINLGREVAPDLLIDVLRNDIR